ncbi:MAG: tetratricopeptide repeat protein [Candidatus Acidiferrales bacterium]
MILRLSSPAARGLLVLLALVLAAGLSYSGIRNALAVHDAGLNTPEGYERATHLEPDDASNWYFLGRYWQYNLEDPDTHRAIHAYKTALSFDPRSADTWLDLGAAYESEGKIEDARNAFLQAKRDYPLSPDVSWRYGNFLLRQGALDDAFAQIKQAVEVDPKRGAAAFALCMRVDPDLNSVFHRALPRSQDAYLSVISSLTDQDQTDQALVVWSRLAALHPQFPVSESYPLLEALIHKLRMTEAQRVWDQALAIAGDSRPPDPPGSLVWDGGFESNVAGGGLTWRYSPYVVGVQINLDAKVRHSGNRSLRLTFNGLQNVNFADACQYILVRPSTTYRFSAWVRTRSLSTDQGVRFGLHSISVLENSIAWTGDVRGTQPWTQVNLPWTSGKDVQELQLCVSRLPSTQFDSKIFGSAWIDDVALVPESAGNVRQ